jgi:hypothetical protein
MVCNASMVRVLPKKRRQEKGDEGAVHPPLFYHIVPIGTAFSPFTPRTKEYTRIEEYPLNSPSFILATYKILGCA